MSSSEGGRTSLTVQDLARSTRLSPNAIYDAIKKGELEAWRPSPAVLRIEPEAVARWKAKKRTGKPRGANVSRLRAIEGGKR